ALVVDAARTRALLMHHRKLGLWLEMGGHADGEGDLAAVALREAFEESGIGGLRLEPGPADVDVHRVQPPGEAAHLHFDVRYVAVAPEGAVEVANEESLELRWFTLAEIEASIDDPSTLRLARLGLAP
ncbi:MAG: NUDIX hydrolase, partial [Actinomycetota bacterium]